MGADDNWQSNLFLPLGKVRMGYPSGEARWGADVDMQSKVTKPISENHG